MRITAHQVLGLPVETQLGQKLGKVTDFEIDVENHLVQKYHVKSGGPILGLFEDTLFIGRAEVIAITKEKMVVEDAVYVRATEQKRTERVHAPIGSAAPAPIQSKNE